jgi:hypothetical protein
MKRGKPLKRTPLAKRSQKMKDTYKERVPLVKKLLGERAWCEACPIFAKHDGVITYTRRPSVDIHEVKRRSQGGSILEESNLMAVCRECHRRIGNHPQLAFDLGLSIHGWEKDK